MKIHPVVGAEILERVRFPYPVTPIVRSHHEKWDGTGYPDGLKGEEIPIGARILAAVDCLDALASDRQYRRALPLDEAMQKVVSESGISFDPKVVEVLHRRYIELEAMAQAQQVEQDETFHRSQDRARPGACRRIREDQRAGFGDTRKAGGLPQLHRRGPPGSAEPVRTGAGSGKFAQPERNAVAAGDPAEAHDPLRFARHLRAARRQAARRIRQRRKFPPVLLARDSAGPGPVGLGGGEPQADHQRQSVGGARLSERRNQVHHHAQRAGGAADRLERDA